MDLLCGFLPFLRGTIEWHQLYRCCDSMSAHETRMLMPLQITRSLQPHAQCAFTYVPKPHIFVRIIIIRVHIFSSYLLLL